MSAGGFYSGKQTDNGGPTHRSRSFCGLKANIVTFHCCHSFTIISATRREMQEKPHLNSTTLAFLKPGSCSNASSICKKKQVVKFRKVATVREKRGVKCEEKLVFGGQMELICCRKSAWRSRLLTAGATGWNLTDSKRNLQLLLI